MVRLFAPGLFGIALFALWVYAILDVIATDSILVRNLPKTTWLFLVIFVPSVGAIAWIALGRPPYAGWRPGDTETRSTRPQQPRATRQRYVAPEDRDDWAARTAPNSGSKPSTSDSESNAAKERRLMEWEAELKRREGGLGEADRGGEDPGAEDS